mmetsp:Transcript_118860/g.341330  ORF Transcript_118860/g.341330 Transcript_118860/m.341330 type:complete len:578 (-) Transcript_118860:191-1924(-)
MVEYGKDESLELPLRGNVPESSDSDTSTLTKGDRSSCTANRLGWLVVDILASAVFWYCMCYLVVPDWAGWAMLAAFVLSLIGWRLYRAYGVSPDSVEEVPYTCGYLKQGAREMFLVATIHISPRAPLDVEKVIDVTRPDVTMIELDDERLDRMRDPAPPPGSNVTTESGPRQQAQPPQPKPEDLQPITIRRSGADSTTIYAQRALWNGEWADQVLRGSIVFDEGNPYGLKSSAGDMFEGSFALVQRGAPNGEFAAFSLKAHYAHQSGAEGLLVINNNSQMPMHRIGGGESMKGDMQVFMKTCSCGFPPVPVLLLSQEDGEKMRAWCAEAKGGSGPEAEVRILHDSYPRRTFRKRLCQAAALIFSGIGVLYGIIQCFAVEVGGEFLTAEIASHERGIRCVCIDVDLNRFWSRLGWAVLPTPWNLFHSLWSWLGFPRVVFMFLYPPRGNIDVLGGMFLHAASFPLRTWLAFILAGFCASKVTNLLLQALGMVGETAAEKSGTVVVHNQEERDEWTTYIMLIIELYLLPQIYDAVAASRDEAMYRSIVAKSRDLNANRMVVVVGAGHSNGILSYARSEGL